MQTQRKSLVLAAIACLSSAIKVTDDETVVDEQEVDYSHLTEHYSSQEQCDTLSNSWKYHYDHNPEACRCFFTFDVPYDPGCHEPTPHFNPLHIPGHTGDLCISQAAYDSIFDHSLGVDCLEGTADDPQEEHAPEIVHVSGQHQCESGTSFDAGACACFEDHQCDINCAELFPSAPFQNPLETCQCIPQAAFYLIYNHNWGTHCVDPDGDNDENDDNDNNDNDNNDDNEDEDDNDGDGDDVNPIDKTCNDGEDGEFDYDLCTCIPDAQCELACHAPELRHPYMCECISVVEFAALYNHGLDENCEPKDDDCHCDNGSNDCCGKPNNITYNFYGPIYGDISAFNTGHATEIDADCQDDDNNEDENNDDDNVGDDSEDEGPVCPDWVGYETECGPNPFNDMVDDYSLPHVDSHNAACASAYGNVYFTYLVERGNWVNAYNHLCSSAQDLANTLTVDDDSMFDNTDFLDWVDESSNPYNHPVLPAITNNTPLPSSIQELFLTSGGACRFVSINDLENALTVLYDYRVVLHLETTVEVEAFDVDTSQCSTPTKEAINEYVEVINDGRETLALWQTLGSFYDFIEDFFECGDSPCH